MQDVLPHHVYLRTLGLLLDTVLGELIKEFEKLTDISEEETHHLHELLSLLFDCPSFFEPRANREEEVEDTTQQQVLTERGQEEIKRYAGRWSKYLKMVNILKSKLVIIVDAYVKGMVSLASCECNLHCVLMVAFFAPNPLSRSDARVRGGGTERHHSGPLLGFAAAQESAGPHQVEGWDIRPSAPSGAAQ
jgi:hypothetical protein